MLEAAGLQLEEQLRFTFSEFPWQTEAMIAIAGVDIYWLRWKAYRSDYDIEEGSPCVPSSDSDIGSTRTRHTGTAAIPFILGTGTSDNEFSKLQRTVGQIVDDRKWKSSDDQYTEHQGKTSRTIGGLLFGVTSPAAREAAQSVRRMEGVLWVMMTVVGGSKMTQKL